MHYTEWWHDRTGMEAVLAVMKKRKAQRLIVEKLDIRVRLETLAEEAAKLSQAALKMIRADRLNPTPLTPIEALENLREEIADVEIAVEMLSLSWMDDEAIEKIKEDKRERWAKLLEGEKTNE